MIAESTYETNENVKKLVGEAEEQNEKNGGFFSNMLTGLLPLAALTGLGGILSTAVGGIAKAFTSGLSKLGSTIVGKTPTTGKTGKTSVANTGQTGDKLKKNKTNMSSKNKKKGMDIAKKFGKGIVRGAGRVFLPLAAALSIFDAATGVAQADELLDKDEGDLTFRDKASAGFAGFLSGLTFGLVDKKKMANRLASTGDKGVDNLDEGTYDVGSETQNIESVPKSVVQGNSLSDQINADVANIKKKYFEGMEPNTTQNYNTVNNVSTNNMAKSDTILPHMSNKNTDKTVIDIQDVF